MDASLGLGGLSISEQCRILGVSRSGYYRWKGSRNNKPSHPCDQTANEDKAKKLALAEAVMDAFRDMPFMGYRKMAAYLRGNGYELSTEKRIRLLYEQLGLRGVAPRFRATRPSSHPAGRFPYLLKDRTIRFVNEVWATDITYIKLNGGMVYLTAVLDLCSRKVLSYRLSNTMDVRFCIDCVKEAIREYGIPAILNCDQGSQYTSREFIDLLQSHGIRISMDGRGRCLDNIRVERYWRTIKYEFIFLNDWATLPELQMGIDESVETYNSKRPHEALGYLTPNQAYENGCFPSVDGEKDKAEVA